MVFGSLALILVVSKGSFHVAHVVNYIFESAGTSDERAIARDSWLILTHFNNGRSVSVKRKGKNHPSCKCGLYIVTTPALLFRSTWESLCYETSEILQQSKTQQVHFDGGAWNIFLEPLTYNDNPELTKNWEDLPARSPVDILMNGMAKKMRMRVLPARTIIGWCATKRPHRVKRRVIIVSIHAPLLSRQWISLRVILRKEIEKTLPLLPLKIKQASVQEILQRSYKNFFSHLMDKFVVSLTDQGYRQALFRNNQLALLSESLFKFP